MHLNFGKTAKAATVVGLTGLSALSGFAPSLATLAYAEPGATTTDAVPDACLKIDAIDDINADMTYNVYKLFNGNVRDTSDKKTNRISEITWVDQATHDAVIGAIKEYDPSYVDAASSVDAANAGESAQDAAEFVATHIGDKDGTNGGTKPSQSRDEGTWAADQSFADILADHVDDLDAVRQVKAGETSDEFDDGYYLVCSDTDYIDGSQRTDQTGTSPIFTVLGGQGVEITEKTGTVTVDKLVKEDSTSEWGDAADQNASKPVEYQLQGTLPDNLASYDSYFYEFHDDVDARLTVDPSTVKVYVTNDDDANSADRVDVTDAFTIDYSSDESSSQDGVDPTRELTVKCDDLLKKDDQDGAILATANINKNSKIVVEYTATINPESGDFDADHAGNIGAKGNKNTVRIEYTKNPNHTDHGFTHTEDNKVYTYQLNIHKQDKQNAARSLKGAKFTIQVKPENSDKDYKSAPNQTDTNSVGKYLQADGSLGDDAYEFTTDDDGNIAIPRIDEGTYLVHESQAPLTKDNQSGDPATPNENDVYDPVPDFTLTIGSNVADMAKLPSSQQKLALNAKIDNSVNTNPASWFKIGSSDATVAFGIDGDGSILNEDGSKATGDQIAASGVNADTGTITVVVRDQKETLMPLTGIPMGVFIEYSVAAGLIIIGLAGAMHTRKKHNSQDTSAAA